jgi:hypothetical protein
MTTEEQQIAENNRDNQSKGALTQLYAIYDRYNNTSNTDCWCSRVTRAAKHKSFYKWYDENNTL